MRLRSFKKRYTHVHFIPHGLDTQYTRIAAHAAQRTCIQFGLKKGYFSCRREACSGAPLISSPPRLTGVQTIRDQICHHKTSLCMRCQCAPSQLMPQARLETPIKAPSRVLLKRYAMGLSSLRPANPDILLKTWFTVHAPSTCHCQDVWSATCPALHFSFYNRSKVCVRQIYS